GEGEADVDVLPGLRVGVLIPGQAADDVAAFLDRLLEQLGGAGIPEQALLGKGDDLDPAEIAKALAREQEPPRRAQAADRADGGDLLARRASQAGADGRDPRALHRDVDEIPLTAHASVAEGQIHGALLITKIARPGRGAEGRPPRAGDTDDQPARAPRMRLGVYLPASAGLFGRR